MAENDDMFGPIGGADNKRFEKAAPWWSIWGLVQLFLKLLRLIFCGTSFKADLFSKNGAYNLTQRFKQFFCGPSKAMPRKDLNIVEQISVLLEHGDEITDDEIHRVHILTNIHRLFENTKARQRLERWASRVIVFYLLIVLWIVLSNYVCIEYSGSLEFMNNITIAIPDKIMFTILSTTTINIIGLGLIVLRGHFLSKDKTEENGKKKKKGYKSKKKQHSTTP